MSVDSPCPACRSFLPRPAARNPRSPSPTTGGGVTGRFSYGVESTTVVRVDRPAVARIWASSASSADGRGDPHLDDVRLDAGDRMAGLDLRHPGQPLRVVVGRRRVDRASARRRRSAAGRSARSRSAPSTRGSPRASPAGGPAGAQRRPTGRPARRGRCSCTDRRRPAPPRSGRRVPPAWAASSQPSTPTMVNVVGAVFISTGPLVPDHHDVLDPDPELPRQIDARLDGERHSGLQHRGVPGDHVGVLVHLETDAVTGPGDEVFPVAGLLNHAAGGLRRSTRR